MKQPQQSAPGAGAAVRRLAPPPALCGFLLLLVLVFTASYAVGATAGPVAPGMYGTGADDGGGLDKSKMRMRHGGGG
ncbi:hypothetical protein SZN_09758 [Streptomyces zinciresistens K42]|uniref:Secreted protein n=1 Tax=Streptomyces zinciresistens K42 TaxID=700597 RepID=G2G8Y3_9ACTN|nr:hypothetical protein [Streptomyces zinciresistens]EGX60045.1 hypothetical protein SZN_09758 [Streptomyces zinciresistens K42]